MAELQQQSGLLARIVDRLPDAEASDDRGEDYRPVSLERAGQMCTMWVDETSEVRWVFADAPYEFVARDRGWKRVYVRRDGR